MNYDLLLRSSGVFAAVGLVAPFGNLPPCCSCATGSVMDRAQSLVINSKIDLKRVFSQILASAPLLLCATSVEGSL